jgi:hypothetical protein
MDLLRKLLSIFVLAILGLPVVLPLFAWSAVSGAHLPLCCRKNGTHHCIDSMSGNVVTHALEFAAPARKCPCFPRAFTASFSHAYKPSTANLIFASLASHPAGIAQTESKWRISRDRTRQKRGPPSNSLL